MKIEDKRVKNIMQAVNDIKVGEAFQSDKGNIYFRSSKVIEGKIMCFDLFDGSIIWFCKDTFVFPINAKVVIE